MKGFKRHSGGLFTLSWGRMEGRTHPGAACIVSSKVAPRAVDRNRLKRLCRAALSTYLTKETQPNVFIFVAKKAAVEAPAMDIRAEIRALLGTIR